ncbi:hypothetical protein FA95DRAFT_1310911 [Auriscalpium vulgare]|uniref:Uncharacterized protein n=1 Tax=Auriscalpium vulgare TaxID=40419 RepID=A0ACB8RTB3_9AGAM|nr:hypothetical protein FA95DRAFT_1310911 [Auriscalpium vulgare]
MSACSSRRLMLDRKRRGRPLTCILFPRHGCHQWRHRTIHRFRVGPSRTSLFRQDFARYTRWRPPSPTSCSLAASILLHCAKSGSLSIRIRACHRPHLACLMERKPISNLGVLVQDAVHGYVPRISTSLSLRHPLRPRSSSSLLLFDLFKLLRMLRMHYETGGWLLPHRKPIYIPLLFPSTSSCSQGAHDYSAHYRQEACVGTPGVRDGSDKWAGRGSDVSRERRVVASRQGARRNGRRRLSRMHTRGKSGAPVPALCTLRKEIAPQRPLASMPEMCFD